MTSLRFPRFERTLGVSLNDLKFEHLMQMVARFNTDPVLEDFDLEFKERVYDENEKNRRELPADVASMANAQGGIILLGIKADNGAAKEAVELALSEAEELRMTNMIMSATFPRPRFEFLRIPKTNDPLKGCFAVLVPKSSDAPHAVRIDDNYRYYRRDGAVKRILSESEIADAYRNRFRGFDDQLQRIHRVSIDGISQLERKDMGWVAVSVAPNELGGMDLNQQSLERIDNWVYPYASSDVALRPAFYTRSLTRRIGARKVTFSSSRDRATHLNSYSYAEFHTDGSGFFASHMPVGFVPDEQEKIMRIHDVSVTELAICGIRLLAEHAMANSGCHGDALVSIRILLPSGVEQFCLIPSSASAVFFQEPLDSQPTPDASRSAINLDEVLDSWRGTLIATRLALADFMQACGIPQCRQIADAGELNGHAWPQAGLQHWAQRTGLVLR